MIKLVQTDDEIHIIIDLSQTMTRRTYVVMLPYYLKFNSAPIFFERHLMHEIDEEASFCKLYKTEARITLFKRQKGIWPFLFRDLTKKQLTQRRMEISDELMERSKAKDRKAFERFDRNKRIEDMNKDARREEMQQRSKQLQKNVCCDAFQLDCGDKGAQISVNGTQNALEAVPPVRQRHIAINNNNRVNTFASFHPIYRAEYMNGNFANFLPSAAPKFELQEHAQNQFFEEMEALKALKLN